jgi:phage replication-related protein YjqB (UPF0714/DUF867 family)
MNSPLTNLPEPYSSFAELLTHEEEGCDFVRIVRERKSPIAIVAPHGGGIEPGTSEIAIAIAADEYSLYCFDSLKTNGNEILHITSHDFDDPLCIAIARASQVVVSVHGCADEQTRVFVGGRNDELCHQLLSSLSAAGFEAAAGSGKYAGKHIDNICNLGQCGAGIQLEISLGARRSMFAGLSRKERQQTRLPFDQFVEAVRKVLRKTNLSR